MNGLGYMAFFDYNRDGKKDWKDNAREYYLYNKFKEEEEVKEKRKKEESSDAGESNVGCGSVLLCFVFLFFAIWLTMMVDSLLK